MILFLTEEAEEQVLTESVISEIEKAIKTLLSKIGNVTNFINLGFKFIESVSENALRILKRQVALVQGLVERTKKDFGSFIQSQNLLSNHSSDLQSKNLGEAASPVDQKFKQMAQSIRGGYFAYVRNCFADFQRANIPAAALEFVKFVAATMLALLLAMGIVTLIVGQSPILFFGCMAIAMVLIPSVIDTYFRKAAVEKGVGGEYAVLSLFFDVCNMLSGVSVIRTAATVVVNFFVSYMLTSSAVHNKGIASNGAVLAGADVVLKRLILALPA